MLGRALGSIAGCLFLVACAQGGGLGRDAGAVPTGFDAGPTGFDAGSMGFDAGPTGFDAGSMDVDGGATLDDAGEDAGPLCVGVDCSALSGPCTVGICSGATGMCVSQPLTDGSACDDGVACTDGRCSAGTCTGTPVDCSSLDDVCAMGACDPATDACVAQPRADGTSCDTDPADCSVHACRAGTCAAANAPDCAGCSVSGGTYCSAGACGAGATSIAYDFESGLPGGWTVGATLGWVVDGARFHGGAMAAHSGAIGSSATSTMTASFSFGVAVEVSFWLYTSTESGYDYLRVFVDGVQQNQWSGTTAWTRSSVVLAPGAHAVEWRYVKDGSSTSGDDRVWIDDVTVAPATPSEGFEATALPAGWTTSGSASWTVTTAQAHGGARSARSGAITHSQTTSLFYTAMYGAAGSVSFWRRVSSESSYDYLEFYLDGALQDRWAGSLTTWTRQSYSVAAGSHSLEWRYLKDGSVSSGDDAGFIDDVVVTDAVPMGNLCAP
ncbi:MAG: hypothetical protein H6719_24285 [Sandaracinaceae bacterium]|nr:hypothetical protein [Sandaracinaceae bacterium]